MGKIFNALEKSKQMTANQDYIVDDTKVDYPSKVYDEVKPNYKIEETLTNVSNTLVTGLNPQSVEAEQFRILKNNILFPENGNPPKSIMITSASPSEGKSFIATNLAVSIAQNIDEHVFLMDCDLRAPSIHSILGFNDNTEGLSEYLTSAKPLSSLLVKTFLNKLTVLLAGKIPPNPSELLSSEQMRRLINEVKMRYHDRYIIIDTPPPYFTSETNAIARQVDGIVIIVRQGQTSKKDIMDLIEIYGKEKIIGVVFNYAKKKTGYGYKKYGYAMKNA